VRAWYLGRKEGVKPPHHFACNEMFNKEWKQWFYYQLYLKNYCCAGW
jgi:hypothetical protein